MWFAEKLVVHIGVGIGFVNLIGGVILRWVWMFWDCFIDVQRKEKEIEEIWVFFFSFVWFEFHVKLMLFNL